MIVRQMMEASRDAALTLKKGTNSGRSKNPVLEFANSAQIFLKARISSRVTALAPPVVWYTYEKLSTTTPICGMSIMAHSISENKLTSEHIHKDVL